VLEGEVVSGGTAAEVVVDLFAEGLRVDLSDEVGALAAFEGDEDSRLLDVQGLFVHAGELTDALFLLLLLCQLEIAAVVFTSVGLVEWQLMLLLHIADPLSEHILQILHFALDPIDLHFDLPILKQMEGNSFAILPNAKLLNPSMRPIAFLNKSPLHKFLIIAIEFHLHFLLTDRIGYIFDHYAEISSGDGVIIDHLFVLDLVVVDEE
jgi:hypothetical protein